MSRMTTTERELVARRRAKEGKPKFLPSARDDGDYYADMGCVYLMSILAQIGLTIYGIVLLCHAVLLGLVLILGIPFLFGVGGSIAWLVRYHKQTNELKHRYLGMKDWDWSQSGRGNLIYVYDKVKNCEPTPVTAQLAELCGQMTIRALALPPVQNIADEDKATFKEWYDASYAEASELADAIVSYDAEMKLAETESIIRTDRIAANTLVNGLVAETKVRKQLKAQNIDPVSAATDALRELTAKSRQVRKQCNVELKKRTAA